MESMNATECAATSRAAFLVVAVTRKLQLVINGDRKPALMILRRVERRRVCHRAEDRTRKHARKQARKQRELSPQSIQR